MVERGAKRLKQEGELVITERVAGIIDLLGVSLKASFPVLLEGGPATGKNTVLKEFSRINREKLVTLNMGEQVDSKAILGSFVPSTLANGLGFEWRPAELVQAMQKGCWLLLCDIHLASAEVLSMLRPLLVEEPSLYVGGLGRHIKPAAGFRVFASGQGSSPSFDLLSRPLWYTINVAKPSWEEMQAIVSTKYAVDRFWPWISSFSAYLDLRKLGRICARLTSSKTLLFLTNADQVAFLQAVFDVLLASMPNLLSTAMQTLLPTAMPKGRQEAVKQVAKLINLLEEQALQVTFGRVAANSHGMMGRTKVSKSAHALAGTRIASQLIERIGVAVNLNEPVLLVGETGTGKTTIVQSLTQLLGGNHLVVVNMSQQSEAGDLLGGLRPVSLALLARKLAEKFEAAFSQVKSKNIDYLVAVQHAFIRKNWPRFLKLLHNATPSISNVLSFEEDLKQFEAALSGSQPVIFKHQDGALAQAIKFGHWILLDEINLASSETLNVLSSLLREDQERHADFRLFACMNPSTDANKRNLPDSIRHHFTEYVVDETDADREDLFAVVERWGDWSPGITESVVELYYRLKGSTQLVNGSGRRPLLNLRTLSRALKYARRTEKLFGVERALFEGFSMSFSGMLDAPSRKLFDALSIECLHVAMKSLPSLQSDKMIIIDGFALPRGPEEPRQPSNSFFVMTPSAKNNLRLLARAVQFGACPVLLEGPTSAGKTSLVEHLAALSGHRCIRINNHEHTDLQEYIGMYVSDSETGQLVFRDGALVQAIRQGHWVILDELNLAPSDVLEALNRLLDDNRELYVAETDEVIKPHPAFILFATQNPAGSVYGGRKVLSRAFRSRFLEIQIDEIPSEEVEVILTERCRLAPSQAKKIATVYRALLEKRQAVGNVFAGRHSLITLRDLFRWALRKADTNEDIAQNGYEVLAERLRLAKDKQFIASIIEGVFKCQLRDSWEHCSSESPLVTWTKPMRRLFHLLSQCLSNNEPALLVGETGCGKTTICQVMSALLNRRLTIVNCHQNSEAADLLGSYRPIRSGDSRALFTWTDGPLVKAMRQGHLLLLDEISLADDSVLERLNSVLESARTLTLAEKNEADVIKASDGFALMATMNPGGDYGKKELSPALRNRFTEIWVSSIGDDEDDIRAIVGASLDARFADPIASFWSFWLSEIDNGHTRSSSMRDVVAWIKFVGCATGLTWQQAFLHGGCLIFVDRLMATKSPKASIAYAKLVELASQEPALGSKAGYCPDAGGSFGIFPFTVPVHGKPLPSKFSFNASTTRLCLLRILRALQIPGRPILIEGSPGIGKTALVTALANATGNRLTRINLSEQTDLSDLFGSDLPVAGGRPGEFRWLDGPFLRALKGGDWIVLDELNLASQSVLEGLNACLDHRGTVYIPELDREFSVDAKRTRIFAAQNPVREGGGRKGLPRSFLSRFSIVWMDPLTADDYKVIAAEVFPKVDELWRAQMISFLGELDHQANFLGSFGRQGAPWEFNLRDLFRWLELLTREGGHPIDFIKLLLVHRFRTTFDRQRVVQLAQNIFTTSRLPAETLYEIREKELIVGRHAFVVTLELSGELILNTHLPLIDSLEICIRNNWLAILNGPSGSGKSHLLHFMARLHGVEIKEFGMHGDVDTLELLGSYEQVNVQRQIRAAVEDWFAATLDLQAQEALHWLDSDRSSAELQAFLSVLPPDRNFRHIQCNSEARFEWVDGPLVRAMQTGSWLVLDNANLCSPSVLDRLNAMFEADNKLAIPEYGGTSDGEVRMVEAHPRFRLFMTVTPKLGGEVSRAMRNRAIELSLVSPNDAFVIDSHALCGRPDLIGASWHKLKQAAVLPFARQSSAFSLSPELTFSLQAPTRILGAPYLESVLAFMRRSLTPENPYAQLALDLLCLASGSVELHLLDHRRLYNVVGLLAHSLPQPLQLLAQQILHALSDHSHAVTSSLVELIFALTLSPSVRTLNRLLPRSRVIDCWIPQWMQSAHFGFRSERALVVFYRLLDASCALCKCRSVDVPLLEQAAQLTISSTDDDSLTHIEEEWLPTIACKCSSGKADWRCNTSCQVMKALHLASTALAWYQELSDETKTLEFAVPRVYRRFTSSPRFLFDYRPVDLLTAISDAIPKPLCLFESFLAASYHDRFLCVLVDYCRLSFNPPTHHHADKDVEFIIDFVKLATFDPSQEYFKLRHLAQLAFRQFADADCRYQKLLYTIYHGITPDFSINIDFEQVERFVLVRDGEFAALQGVLARLPAAALHDKPALLHIRGVLCKFRHWLDLTTPVIDAIDRLIGVDFKPLKGQLSLTMPIEQPDIEALLFNFAGRLACGGTFNDSFDCLIDALYAAMPEREEPAFFHYRNTEDEEAADAKIESDLFSSYNKDAHIDSPNKLESLIKATFSVLDKRGLVEVAFDSGCLVTTGFKSFAWQATRPIRPTAMNVYADPATQDQLEATLRVITELDDRLRQLQEHYPDHDVLQQLKRQLAHMAYLVHPPLISLCLSLERFLVKAQDWQIVAPKDLSLNLDGMTRLIVDFRRVELASWRSILASVCSQYFDAAVTKAFIWLARLVRSEGSQTLIDAFLLAAPLGQFEARLRMLRLLHPDTRIYSFYAQLLPVVVEYTRSITDPLDAELQAHLITITWNDTTVCSLQQSIAKSHRIIARIVRRYRDTLDVPMSSVLAGLSMPLRLPASTGATPLDRVQRLVEERVRELQDIENIPIKEKAFVDLLRLLHHIGVKLNLVSFDVNTSGLLDSLPIGTKFTDPLLHNIRSWLTIDEALQKCDEMTMRQVQAMRSVSFSLLEHSIRLASTASPHDSCLLKAFRMDEPVRINKHGRLRVALQTLKTAVAEYQAMSLRFGMPNLPMMPIIDDMEIDEWVEHKDWLAMQSKILDFTCPKGGHREEQIMLEPILAALAKLKRAVLKTSITEFPPRSSLGDAVRGKLGALLCLPFVDSFPEDALNEYRLAKKHLARNESAIASYPIPDLVELFAFRKDPLVIQAVKHYADLIEHANTHTSSVINLHSRLLIVFHGLAQKGFCRPRQSTEGQTVEDSTTTANETPQDSASGASGMAEGIGGEKNVSGEMEFEEQLTGTRQALQEQAAEDSDAIDMRQDFDAQLQDLMEEGIADQPDNPEACRNDDQQQGERTEEQHNMHEDAELKDEMGENDKMDDIQALDKDATADSRSYEEAKNDSLGPEGTAKDDPMAGNEGEVESAGEEDAGDDGDNAQTAAEDFAMSTGESDLGFSSKATGESESELESEANFELQADSEPQEEEGLGSEMDEEDSVDEQLSVGRQADDGMNEGDTQDAKDNAAEDIMSSVLPGDEQETVGVEDVCQGAQSEAMAGKQSTKQTSSPPAEKPLSMAEMIDRWYRSVHSISSEKLSESNLEKEENYGMEQEFGADEESAIGALGSSTERKPNLGNERPADQAPSADTPEATQKERAKTTSTTRLPGKHARQEDADERINVETSAKDKETKVVSWADYEEATHGLATELCEQLRLILAPTVASKMRGDYRTGRRLNIRKILPYIASQYRRDRIWLRRTKPSKRDYQVCLAIDNSRSMRNDPHTASLAMQSVALITQALARLEVGDVGLVSFGREAHVLQELGRNSLDGDRLVQGLTFDDPSTDVHALLSNLDAVFSSSATTSWKLVIIISDGICDRHELIRRQLVDFLAHRILAIFIIIDTRPAAQSIVELARADYDSSGQIRLRKYLETFPFEYYVVVRQVEMLPLVLSEALKQWFELVRFAEQQP